MNDISILEKDVIMGTFTHRDTYYPTLQASVDKHLPNVPFIVMKEDGPINLNMERLRQRFIESGKRYWIYLDDDIQFLNSSIVSDAVRDLMANKWGAIGVYSTYDPVIFDKNYTDVVARLHPQGPREVHWIPGYFILVDSQLVGHLGPSFDLPSPTCLIDIDFCMKINAAGYKVGLSDNIIYHAADGTDYTTQEHDEGHIYLKKKWGNLYPQVLTYLDCYIEF